MSLDAIAVGETDEIGTHIATYLYSISPQPPETPSTPILHLKSQRVDIIVSFLAGFFIFFYIFLIEREKKGHNAYCSISQFTRLAHS